MKAGEDYIGAGKTPGLEFTFLNEALELVNLGARVIAHAVEARLGVIEGGTIESEERLSAKTAAVEGGLTAEYVVASEEIASLEAEEGGEILHFSTFFSFK